MSSPLKVLSIIGTRPEAIKMAPLVRLLHQENEVVSQVLVTAQHRQMLDQVLTFFEIPVDFDLDIMRPGQSPTIVAAEVMRGLDTVLQTVRPDWVLVQGDTTTVMAAAIAAFYARVQVGHVEAGLRTYNRWQPFPEEINRRIAGITSSRHFAPTPGARQNLLSEGVQPSEILVTGNTVIDALNWTAEKPFDFVQFKTIFGDNLTRLLENSEKRIVLVTAHRRENFGEPFERICAALRKFAERYTQDVHVVYPVHPNPNIIEPARRMLGNIPNISLLPPLDYLPLVQIMKKAYFVMTDSGGIQEEAPGLGKPVIVLREVTERPEAVLAGTVRLAGADPDKILSLASQLMEDSSFYAQMSQAVNPYGDGQAARRIVNSLLGRPVSDFVVKSISTDRYNTKPG